MKNSDIGKNIRRARERKRLSQEKVAFELGKSQPAYSKIERGKTEVTVTTLLRLANIFEMRVVKLLKGLKDAPPARMAARNRADTWWKRILDWL